MKAKLAKIWKGWVMISVRIYNRALFTLRKYDHKNEKISKYNLRNDIKKYFKDITEKWSLPNTTLEYAVFEAITAFKQSKDAEYRHYNKQTSFAISIDGRSIKNGYIYKRNTGQQLKKKHSNRRHYNDIMSNIRLKKLNNVKTTQVCKLVYKKHYNEFYLVIPEKIKNVKTTEREIISLDPGVRSFMTFYDGESCGEIGKDKYKQLKRLGKEKDKIDIQLSVENRFFRKCKLKKARAKIYKRINNIVHDLHYKTINFLVKYKIVLLPSFKVKGMLPTLNKYVRRSLLDLSHYKFKLRLAQKASENDMKLIICNESYTSKTCTGCGVLNNTLGKNKTFKCSSCKLCIDRDVNGARNIMLRALRGGSWKYRD